jgi:Cof subfamily protein (haloacid dehalogenase superfamily)
LPDPASLDTLPIEDTACGLPTPFRRSVRLIALDIDGTLLRGDKKLSKPTVAAIAAARRRGVRVVLATARPPRSTLPIHAALDLDTPVITYNGAVIHDPARSRTLRHLAIDGAIALRIILAARRYDPSAAVHADILDKWCTDRPPDPATVRFQMPDFIGPIEAFTSHPVTKLLLGTQPGREDELADLLARKFVNHVGVATCDDGLLQIQHRRVDKAEALALLAHTHNLRPEQVMAIGDAHNDIGMLRWAGLGVAMGNAWPAAIRAADVTVPSNNDEGVAHAIERFVLRA